MPRLPRAHLLTFRTYGTWLHGDSRGSMATGHAEPGTAVLPWNERRWLSERGRMTGEPVILTPAARLIAAAAIDEVCDHRAWCALAVNVRTNHVHVVLEGCDSPSIALATMKAWSTRRLRDAGEVGPTTRLWSRHGSTRFLWSDGAVQRAVAYVVEWQDERRG